mmetsp:Transcript_44576/g.142894  ORF Transcript_44576/g.142894 Transcript_44576/m.142894 type:complete len:202 (-) Transcript_44576:348-953(-)
MGAPACTPLWQLTSSSLSAQTIRTAPAPPPQASLRPSSNKPTQSNRRPSSASASVSSAPARRPASASSPVSEPPPSGESDAASASLARSAADLLSSRPSCPTEKRRSPLATSPVTRPSCWHGARCNDRRASWSQSDGRRAALGGSRQQCSEAETPAAMSSPEAIAMARMSPRPSKSPTNAQLPSSSGCRRLQTFTYWQPTV